MNLADLQELYKKQQEYAKKKFNNKCPYTGHFCTSFRCLDCEVEKREREWVKRK